MSRRARRLSIIAALVLSLGMLAFTLFPGRTMLGTPDSPAQSAAGEAESPIATVDAVGQRRIGSSGLPKGGVLQDLPTYAVSSAELEGLPPDPQPGTRLELWVAWEPPITKEVRFQKLLSDVRIQQVVPGVVAEEPSTVLLALEPSQISDVLYGDRYGSLSVVVLPTP